MITIPLRTVRTHARSVGFGTTWLRLGILLGYLAVAAGIPLFPPAPSTEARFPCEDGPCGCGGPEQCWTVCRCTSLQEKLAWAEREGIQPPEIALARARAEGLDVSPWVAPESQLADARPNKRTAPTCCCCEKSAAPNSGCCANARVQSQANLPPQRTARRNHRAPTILSRALACKGMGMEWLSMAAVVPAARVTWAPTQQVSLDGLGRPDSLFLSEPSAPEPPPPELA